MKRLILLVFMITSVAYGQWVPLGDDIDGVAGNDQFGYSVSLSDDGTVLAIGAPFNDGNGSNSGHVRVFENQAGNWVQIGDAITGSSSSDRSGFSVSLSGNGQTLAIGAPDEGTTAFEAGEVRVFQNQAGSWQQLGDPILGEALSDHSGFSVSLNVDGTIVAIGGPDNEGDSGGNFGHVRVYEYDSGSWEQLGEDIDGEAQEDNSGVSVSLSDDGTLLAIGAPFNDDSASDAGHVRVYQYESDSWEQLGEDIDGEASNDRFGNSVNFNANGNRLAVGAIDNNGIGHVRVFEWVSNSWTQIGEDIDGIGINDNFGNAVSLNAEGTILAIGAPLYNDGGNDIGLVQVYKEESDQWELVDNNMIGEAQEDRSGFSVSLSADGSTVAVGGYLNDDNGANAGHARVWHNASILAVNEPNLKNNVLISPTPSSNDCTIYLGAVYSTIELKIFDALQRRITAKSYHNVADIKMDTDSLTKGVYFIKLYLEGSEATLLRLVKE